MSSIAGDMQPRKRVALDNMKTHMLEWAQFNIILPRKHDIVATATTGQLLKKHLSLTLPCSGAASSVVTNKSAPELLTARLTS